MHTIIYEKEGGIARITLNRPERHNAQNSEAVDELNAVADGILNDPEIRIVTIRGAGKSFSSGIDLKDLADGTIRPDYFMQWERVIRKFETMNPVVLTCIHGHCLGGAVQLLLGCDIRIATNDAIFGLPAVREGLIPGLSALRLSLFIGLGRAKRMIFSGKTIDAFEAERIGLVDHIIPFNHAEEEFEFFIREYHSSCGTAARNAKKILTDTFIPQSLWLASLTLYHKLQNNALNSSDFKKAVEVLREKYGKKPLP